MHPQIERALAAYALAQFAGQTPSFAATMPYTAAHIHTGTTWKVADATAKPIVIFSCGPDSIEHVAGPLHHATVESVVRTPRAFNGAAAEALLAAHDTVIQRCSKLILAGDANGCLWAETAANKAKLATAFTAQGFTFHAHYVEPGGAGDSTDFFQSVTRVKIRFAASAGV